MPLLTPGKSLTTIDRSTATWGGLGLLAGLFAAALSPHPGAGMVLAVLLLLGAGWVAAATYLTSAGSDALVCELPRPPDDFHALSSFPLHLRLVNAHRHWPALCLRSFVRVRSGGLILYSPPFLTPQLGPRQAAEFNWRITACARGEHEILDLRVISLFPGSLIVREQWFGLERRLLARPAVYRLHDRATQMLIGRRHAAGRMHASPAAMEEFIGVRPFRAGDNPRHIHLVTSLRVPDYPIELAVREFEDPTDDDVCIVLDTGIADDETNREFCEPLLKQGVTVEEANHKFRELLLYRHEKSLSFTVALCRLLCTRKYRVRFCCLEAAGKTCNLQLLHPVKDLARLEARLARLQPTADRPAVWRLLERQAGSAQAAVLYVSLREVAEEKHRPRLAVLSITPDWQMSLVRGVAGT